VDRGVRRIGRPIPGIRKKGGLRKNRTQHQLTHPRQSPLSYQSCLRCAKVIHELLYATKLINKTAIITITSLGHPPNAPDTPTPPPPPWWGGRWIHHRIRRRSPPWGRRDAGSTSPMLRLPTAGLPPTSPPAPDLRLDAATLNLAAAQASAPPAQASTPLRRRCPESGAPPPHRAARRRPPSPTAGLLDSFDEHDRPIRGCHFHGTQLLFVPGSNTLDPSSSRPPGARFVMGGCILFQNRTLADYWFARFCIGSFWFKLNLAAPSIPLMRCFLSWVRSCLMLVFIIRTMLVRILPIGNTVTWRLERFYSVYEEMVVGGYNYTSHALSMEIFFL
jgi:hypothetical protein